MRSFLDLPSEIRHRIYKAAGLVVGMNLRLTPRRDDTINLRLTPRRDDTGYFGFQPSAESLCITSNLLQTCKAIIPEVASLVYSQNTLVVVHEHVRFGLEFLRCLSPQQCSALTNLVVQLHLEAPVLGDDFTELEPTPPLDSALVASWQAAARHILSHTRPQTLNLRLFCDTGVGDTTAAVLQPLRDFPGVLKDCELQLHHEKNNNQARALAFDAATRAKGFDPDLRAQPFRFFDLPAEIRRRILEYSDLVTPFKEVYWSASRGFRIATALIRCGRDECDTQLHRGCHFLFCEPLNSLGAGYVCCRRRSAYSSRCQCWVAPRGPFSASRSLYEESLQVLYSCNRIIVVPSKGLRSCLLPDGVRKRLDASKFITRHMWPDVLHNLRTIEFVLPAFDAAYAPVSDELYYSDFRFAIDHLKAYADEPKLSIVISITSPTSIKYGGADDMWIFRRFTGGDSVALRSYAQLLSCLKALQGMRCFFVHLEWARHWTAERAPDFNHLMYSKVNKMESWLEKMVMGQDYDSEAAGKSEPPSIWLCEIRNTLEHVRWRQLPEEQMLTHI